MQHSMSASDDNITRIFPMAKSTPFPLVKADKEYLFISISKSYAELAPLKFYSKRLAHNSPTQNREHPTSEA